MKRVAATLIALSALYPTAARADTTGPTEGETTTTTLTVGGEPVNPADPALPEYQWQIAHGAPGIIYWSKVAHCETRGDWQDHGRFAGGLGIFTQRRFGQRGMGTWERWGGEQFGTHPSHATPLQQIVVANRIAMFGWKATYRDWNGRVERVIQASYYKKPAGFNGWGCIKQNRSGPLRKNRYLNPARFERNRARYWRNAEPYTTHNITLWRMNTPRWAWDRIPHEYLR